MPREIRWRARALGLCAIGIYGAATLVIAAWAVGFALTDRTRWSQYLWWIPWQLAAAAIAPAVVLAVLDRRPARRWWRRFVLVGGLGVVGLGLSSDVRLGSPHGHGDLRVVHWNASWPDRGEGEVPAAALAALDPDILIVSNPFQLFRDGRADEWRARGYDVVMLGVFLVASRVPLLEARQPLSVPPSGAGTDSPGFACALAFVRAEAPAVSASPITIWAVDLPSGPELGRREVATRFRERIDRLSLPLPALVVGDFNIKRGSASVADAFPQLDDAWRRGGVGYGASWPRGSALWHIDLALVGDGLDVTSYRLVDVGAGVHLAQVLDLAKRAD